MYYPYVKYPIQINKYLNNFFPDLEAIEVPPGPKLIKQDYRQLGISLLIILLLIILIDWNVGGFLLYSIIVFIIIYLFYDSLKVIRYVMGINNVRIKTHQKELKSIAIENERRKKEKNHLIKNNLIEAYTKEKIKNVLKSYSPGDQMPNVFAKKGAAERYFLKFLYSHFGNNIKPSYRCQDSSKYDNNYSPDFVFENGNIVIDIEIDEPYAFDGRKPIHLHNEAKNENRDDFFVSKNWIVIRFAEEQVLLTPYECCKYIANEIYKFTENDSFLKKLSFRSDLKPIKFWDEVDALNMASQNYRENIFSKANALACEIDLYPKNYFLDDGVVILTKIGEVEISECGKKVDYIECYNNTDYNLTSILCNKQRLYKSKSILLNKQLFPEIEYFETFDIIL